MCVRIAVAIAGGPSSFLPDESLGELFGRDGLLLAVRESPEGHDTGGELALATIAANAAPA